MKRNIYGLILSAFLFSVGFTSCLNDDMIDDQKYGLINLNANKIIEIPAGASHEKSLVLLPEGMKELTIGEVRLAAEDVAAEDIVVKLTTDAKEFLKEGQKAFPVDKIVVPASVTIKKGERSVPLVVTINTAFLESNPLYVPISISSVDNAGYIVSGNFNVLKLNMKVKHKLQGRYVLTGSFTDAGSAVTKHITTLDVGGPYTVQLQTEDGATLIFYDELVWEDFLYPMANNGAFSGFGSFCPMFTFDGNNVTAVTNAYGQPAANTRSAQLDPSGINKYDPATKTIKVSYWMNQPSVIATPPNHRVSFVETYTYLEDI